MLSDEFRCTSLRNALLFAQRQFASNFDDLVKDIGNQGIDYGFKLLDIAQDQQFVSNSSKQNEILKDLKTRVLLRVLEDLEDPSIVSISDLIITM